MSRREAPPGMEEPAFAEPWQAEAFALTVALHEKGLFSWSEWAEALSAEVKKPGAASDGHDYYEHRLAALEKLLASKGVAAGPEVDAMAAAWERAAHATPHGKPRPAETSLVSGATVADLRLCLFSLRSKMQYHIVPVLTISDCVDR